MNETLNTDEVTLAVQDLDHLLATAQGRGWDAESYDGLIDDLVYLQNHLSSVYAEIKRRRMEVAS